MRHYILASHKLLAQGFHTAAQAIIGEVENVHTISAYVSSNDLSTEIEECFSKIALDDEVIVMSDIYGGSVNNEFMKYLGQRDFHLIAGVNLAIVLSLMVELQGEITREKIIEKIEECKETLRYCNDDIKEIEEEDF